MTTREAAIQFLNDHAEHCDAMAECEGAARKCHKNMMKIDGMDDGAKKFHSDMHAKCEKAEAAWTAAANKHRAHAAALGKTVGEQDLNKIVPDGVKVINENPSLGLGGQLNADAAKVTMVLRTGQRNLDTVDVDSEFQHMVKTEG